MGNRGLKWILMGLNLLFLLCSELQQRLDPISLDWFIYPPFVSFYLRSLVDYIRFDVL
jgi:hypothetical protein